MKWSIRLLSMIVVSLLLVSCTQNVAIRQNERELDIVPFSIDTWVEQSKSMFLAQSRVFDGKRHILVTYGQQPTGGFAVNIERVETVDGKHKVLVNFTRPQSDQIVTQALTYPYDMEIIEEINLPIEFVPSGDEQFVPTLLGIGELRNIVASSKWIRIFAPTPNGNVERNFLLEGVANVFEGNVQYRILDSQSNELMSSFTTGAMGDWGYFRSEVQVPKEVGEGESITLDIFTTSAKDGAIEQQILIELTMR